MGRRSISGDLLGSIESEFACTVLVHAHLHVFSTYLSQIVLALIEIQQSL